MRVIAGTARSIQLKTLEGLDTRPTTDRIKETLFNILQMDIQGSRFLDLFSGSGAIGIEALSRGAVSCALVDNSRRACECIRENLEKTHLKDKAIVMETDVITAINRLNSKKSVYDIVFMDPPYSLEIEAAVLDTLNNSKIIDEYSLIIIEAVRDRDFGFSDDCGFEIIREKIYKTNKHVFLRKKA